MERFAFSVADFCASRCISRAKFYELLAAGLAPQSFTVGSRRLISAEAAKDWRARMEHEAHARNLAGLGQTTSARISNAIPASGVDSEWPGKQREAK